MSNQRCYVAVTQGEGFSIGVAEEGEPGYYKLDYPTVPTYAEATHWADLCNKDLGVGPIRAAEIICSTMAVQRRKRVTL
jgi:hypothetical protein